MQVDDIIARAAVTLQDPGYDRWSQEELLAYINDAQRTLALARPDEFAKVRVHQVTRTHQQALPPQAYALIDVPRNAHSRQAITQVDAKLLDVAARAWEQAPAGTGAAVYHHYTHDLRNPRVFQLYPAPAVFAQPGAVEVVVAEYPGDCALGGPLRVHAQWAVPVYHYVLFRAFSKDAEVAANGELAAHHHGLFQAAVGQQLQSKAAVAPAA